jgi:glycerate 2-kinase
MARGAFAVLGSEVKAGVLILPPATGADPASLPALRGIPSAWRAYRGGHPIPTDGSVAGSLAVAALARSLGQDDLFLLLLSGGGSALMTLPPPGVSLGEVQRTTGLLLRAGADIGELNTVRKHLDQVKGGRLARLAAPARAVALVLSDVVGNPPEVIASGPVSPDPSSYGDALGILRDRGLLDRIPPSVRAHLEGGGRGEHPESPGPGDPVFRQVDWRLVGSNRMAVEAAAREAEQRGFEPRVETVPLEGEAREVGADVARRALEAQEGMTESTGRGRPAGGGAPRPGIGPRPACLLRGGETTVTVTGSGRGGRNQELALGAGLALEGAQGILVASLGTDGVDGPTPAAGALVDGTTLARARERGLDPHDALHRNDTFPFFDALGDLLLSGPTGTNVMDLVVTLVDPPVSASGRRVPDAQPPSGPDPAPR